MTFPVFATIFPFGLTLQQWADAFVNANTYGVIFPRLMQESDYERWAAEVVHNPVLAGYNPPQPGPDWQVWAQQLNQVLAVATSQ